MNSHLVKPGSKLNLSKINPNDCGKWEGKKEEAKKRLSELTARLGQLQEILYAEHKNKVLIVIQGMDGGGKDGTIRSVFEGVNLQGVHIANFKAPSTAELDHDYLWRVHAKVPGKGEIVVFNRSHYEDVLIVRVHNLVPQNAWEKRYLHILEFERMLSDEGTIILKFCLYIDQEEQKKRLLERLADPTKQWKFNPNDSQERKKWGQYLLAYQNMLDKTSTEFAPWYLIPANHNWYRNLAIASVIVDKLESLNMQYPVITGDLEAYKNEIEAS